MVSSNDVRAIERQPRRPAADNRRAPFELSVHVYPSPFEYETRMLKITRTLIARALARRVVVMAQARAGLAAHETIDDAREVMRIRTLFNGVGLWRKTLTFIEWSVRILVRLRAEPVDLVNCHSLSVLPLCALLAWWHDAILIYEPHELETETTTSKGLRRRVAKWLERTLIRRADCVIVVSRSIAEHYRRDYHLADVPVILNAPEAREFDQSVSTRLFRDLYGIPAGQLIFMYQGVLSESRGVHLLLDAFRDIGPDRHLVLMGFGPLEKAVRAAAATAPNIHLHPPVPPDKILDYTRGADIGLTLLSDDCVNHRCALPNKLFHYLHAGLPVVVSDLEEMANLAERYRCGWRVGYDAASIATVVAAIDAESVAFRRLGARRAQQELNWEHEADKLEAIYRRLPPSSRPSQHDPT